MMFTRILSSSSAKFLAGQVTIKIYWEISASFHARNFLKNFDRHVLVVFNKSFWSNSLVKAPNFDDRKRPGIKAIQGRLRSSKFGSFHAEIISKTFVKDH